MNKKVFAVLLAGAMSFCATTCFAASRLEYFKTVTVMQPEVFAQKYTVITQGAIAEQIQVTQPTTLTEQSLIFDAKLTLVEFMKLKGMTK